MTPTISISFDPADEKYVLMATSFGRIEVAGPRIFRAPPHPDIIWRHSTEESAKKDAEKLTAYFNSLGKAPSRKKVRTSGAIYD